MKVKNFDDVEELRQFIPIEQDAQSFDSVSCLGVLPHYRPKDEFAEMLGKVCYVTKKKLRIELRVNESNIGERPFGAPLVADNGLTLLTTLRVKIMLGHQSFLIKEQTYTENGMMKVVATRMSEVDWDGAQPLWKYPEDTIVKTPLYYPQFINTFRRIDDHGIDWGKWKKVNQLIDDFKIWLFAPIYYCITCGKQHQGAHRIAVARELGMSTIRVRIIRCWWERKIGEPKGLEHYLNKEDYEKQSTELEYLTKPSKVYQEYLKAKKRGVIK